MNQKPISPALVARLTEAARYVISGVTPATWFGPMQPLKPQAPEEVSGRRFDYPVGYNINIGQRSNEPVSFDDLRALADNCDILRSVIETRKDQVESLEWRVRLKASRYGTEVFAKPTDEQKRRIEAVENFLQYPDRRNSFAQWLRQILEDMFVLDAVAIYKRRNVAGGMHTLEVLDGASIRLLLNDSGRTPDVPDPAYQQILKGVPAVDYTTDELIYIQHNPRSHKVYGYSHVEQVLVTVNILIRRALHQLEYYREGSQPDALIGLPKEWTQDQISTFQKHFDALLAGNSALKRHVRFMPGDFKYQETKAPPLKDAYDEFLARIICYVFSVSPEPFVGQVNRATAESSQTRAIAEGLAPLQKFVSGLMNRIIQREMGCTDLEFAWQDTREQDPKEAAQIDVTYVSSGILTADEVRERMGLPKAVASSERLGASSFNIAKHAPRTTKSNLYHVPAGNSDGGQFTTADRVGGNSSDSYVDNDSVDQNFVTDAISGAIGLAGAATVGIGSTIVEGLSSIGGELFGTEAETTLGTVTEEASATRNADLLDSQIENYNRFKSKLPSTAKEIKIIEEPSGARTFRSDVPAKNIPGSYARYEKTVNEVGKTLEYKKITYAPDGSVVHIKFK